MKCPNCQKLFDANWQLDHQGGQEAPGTFLVIGFAVAGAGIGLHYFGISIWPWVLYGIAGFVLLQAMVAWMDCSGTYCPECKFKVRVWPWSK